jgi:hypothetical protein
LPYTESNKHGGSPVAAAIFVVIIIPATAVALSPELLVENQH